MKPPIDISYWPVVVVDWPPVMTAEDVDAHFVEIRALASRTEALGIVVDMTLSGTPAAPLRRHAARQLEQSYAVAGRRIVGVAHVITSPLVRGMLSAVYWLSPPPFRTVVVGSRTEAIE